jgi:predicted nucleic acid-binding protein
VRNCKPVVGSSGTTFYGIAAHAKAAKLILVTNYEQEFQRASGLEIQNWATVPTSSAPM